MSGDYDLLLMPTRPLKATPIRAAHGDHRDDREHRAARRHGPSDYERAVWAERRAAGRDDADGEAPRRGVNLPRGIGVREGRELEGGRPQRIPSHRPIAGRFRQPLVALWNSIQDVSG